MSLPSVLMIAAAYLVGSIPMAYLVGKAVKGIDLRHYGSGNLGGSNVFAHVGKGWVIFSGGFDFLVKGVLISSLAHWALDLDSVSQGLVGLAAVAGHNWSLYLRFSGGRGLGTALGVLTVLAWRELAILASLGFIGGTVLRSSGLLFFIGILILPLASLLFREPSAVTVFATGFLALTAVKRLTAGGRAPAPGTGWGRLLLYRLLFDRDVSDRDAWLRRTPEGKQEEQQ